MRVGPSRVSSQATTARVLVHARTGRYAPAVLSPTAKAWPRFVARLTRVMRMRATPLDESWKATSTSRPAPQADGQNVETCFVANGSAWTGGFPGGAT